MDHPCCLLPRSAGLWNERKKKRKGRMGGLKKKKKIELSISFPMLLAKAKTSPISPHYSSRGILNGLFFIELEISIRVSLSLSPSPIVSHKCNDSITSTAASNRWAPTQNV